MSQRKPAYRPRTPEWVKTIGWLVLTTMLCFGSGVIGGALTRNFGTSSYTMSYADFISILLSAISVLLTVLGLLLAVLAFIGWRSITSTVENRTVSFLDEGFQDGNPLHDLVITRTREIMYRGIIDIDTDNQADDTRDEIGREE